MSLAEFFWQGDALTRSVALLLLAMSVASWVVIVWKSWLLQRAGTDVARCVAAFWQSVNLAEAAKKIQAFDSAIQVESIACPLFVPLAEEGWHDDDITRQVAERYLGPLKNKNIDTVVLGCTHYPLLKITLQKILGPTVSLIDSGDAISQLLADDFTSGKLLKNDSEKQTNLKVCLTDFGPQFESLATQLIQSVSDRTIQFETVSVI